jgi:hypothetical protein
VDDPVERRLCVEELLARVRIGEIDVDPFGLLAADRRDAVEDFLARVGQVVRRDAVVAALQQLDRGMRADESEPARDEDAFHLRT